MVGVVALCCGYIGDLVEMLSFIKISHSKPGDRTD